jgi:hypothetical protein
MPWQKVSSILLFQNKKYCWFPTLRLFEPSSTSHFTPFFEASPPLPRRFVPSRRGHFEEEESGNILYFLTIGTKIWFFPYICPILRVFSPFSRFFTFLHDFSAGSLLSDPVVPPSHSLSPH